MSLRVTGGQVESLLSPVFFRYTDGPDECLYEYIDAARADEP
jgi:hypothetical protein